jgi:hypothetical protein
VGLGKSGRQLASFARSKSRWVGFVLTAAAIVIAFLGPFNLPTVWKGAVAALGVLIGVGTRFATSQGRQSEHVAAVQLEARNRGRAQLLERVDAELTRVGTIGSLGVSLDYRLGAVPTGALNHFVPGESSPEANAPTEYDDIEIAFQAAGRHLLLLGAGGSGKTWVLASLARRLYDAAKADSSVQIPVVLQLGNWGREESARPEESGGDFVQWVADELSSLYRIPPELSRWWLKDSYEFTLLLDGLDEVIPHRRQDCIRGIRGFLDSYGLNGLLITSRNISGHNLSAELGLSGAAELMPLSIDTLIESGSQLPLISELTESDLEDWARELLDTPLMVTVASAALSQLPRGQLREVSKDMRRSLMFDTYIEAAIGKRQSAGLAGHSTKKFLGYLVGFANLLAALGLTTFVWRNLTSATLSAGLRRWVTIALPLLAGAGAGALTSLKAPPWWAAALGLCVSLLLIPDAPLPHLSWPNNRDLAVAICAVLLAITEAVVISKIGGVRGLLLAAVLAALLVLGPWTDSIETDGLGACALGIGVGLAGVAVFWAQFTSSRLANIALGAVSAILCCALLLTLWFTYIDVKFRKPEDSEILENLGMSVLIGMLLIIVLALFSTIFLAVALVLRQPLIAFIPVIFGTLSPAFWWIYQNSTSPPLGFRSDRWFMPYEPVYQISLLAPIGAILTVPVVNDWLATPLVALLGWMLYISFYLRREHDGIPPFKRPAIHALLTSQGIIPWRFRLFADSAVDRMLLRPAERGYMFWHPLLQEHIYQKSID